MPRCLIVARRPPKKPGGQRPPRRPIPRIPPNIPPGISAQRAFNIPDIVFDICRFVMLLDEAEDIDIGLIGGTPSPPSPQSPSNRPKTKWMDLCEDRARCLWPLAYINRTWLGVVSQCSKHAWADTSLEWCSLETFMPRIPYLIAIQFTCMVETARVNTVSQRQAYQKDAIFSRFVFPKLTTLTLVLADSIAACSYYTGDPFSADMPNMLGHRPHIPKLQCPALRHLHIRWVWDERAQPCKEGCTGVYALDEDWKDFFKRVAVSRPHHP